MATKTNVLATACLLFVPASRPDRFERALRASPGGIIIDLEDAVATPEKARAREAAAQFLATRPADETPPILLRINAADTADGLLDLLALRNGTLPADGIVLPKVETPRDIALLRAHLGEAPCPVLALVETARGIHGAAALADALHPEDALGFGGADLAADLGATLAWEPLLMARSLMVLAARHRLALFDVPHLTARAETAVLEEAKRARALGFTGKLAIHPDQVPPIEAAFAPTEAEIGRAREVLAAFSGGGVVIVNGTMVDAPVAAAARSTLRRAGIDL